MRPKKTLILCLFLISGRIFGQDPLDNYLNRMNYIFANVDKNKVNTGLLSDFGLQTLPIDYYNGIPRDSTDVDINIWRALYTSIYSSRFNNFASIPSQSEVFNSITQNTPTDEQPIPFAIMLINYNKLKDDAYTSGLVQIQNDQIFDVAGANPYETNVLFAAAPLQTNIKGSTVNFVLKSSLYYTNADKTITETMVDPGDGNGFRNINWDSPFSISYSSSGIKNFNLKLSFSDGSILQTHGKIYVNYSNQLKSVSGYYLPNNSLIQIFDANSNHSGGTVTVRFGKNHSDKIIRKPFIVAEGFDPWKIISGNIKDNMNIDVFLNLKNREILGHIDVPLSSGEYLGDYLYRNGYDIIYLDYNEGTDDIKRNAKLLEQVIDWVKTQKQNNGVTEKNVVLGISMGGLVARWALRDLETHGIDHQTRLYISMDSPHNGANVPLGVQAAIRHTECFKVFISVAEFFSPSDQFDALKGIQKLLDCQAARQMLIYYAKLVDGNIIIDNSTHDAFMAEYNNMGFPLQCRNVTISDGAGNGTKLFSPYSEIVSYSDSYSLNFWQELLVIFGSYLQLPTSWYNIVPGKSQLKSECYINALPNRQQLRLYHGHIYLRKKLLWLIPVETDFTNMSLYSTSDMYPLDGAPGGVYNISMLGGQLPFSSESIKQQQFCFVPTASSLALKNWQSYLTSDLTGANLLGNGMTEFHNYSPLQLSNDLHTKFNSSANFIKQELENCPTFSPGTPISGPASVCSSGTQFIINNLPSGFFVNWNCSSNITLASNQGSSSCTFNANNSGTGWIEATITSSCQIIKLPKLTVWVGVPYIMDVWGPTYETCINIENQFYATVSGANYYNWQLNGYAIAVSDIHSTGLNVYWDNYTSGDNIVFQASNECGLVEQTITITMPQSCWDYYNSYSLSPNPASDYVSLTITSAKNSANSLTSNTLKSATVNSDAEFSTYSIRVLSNFGLPVYTAQKTGKTFTIPVTNFQDGIYLVELNDGKNIHRKQLIVKH